MLTIKKNKIMKILATAFLFSLFSIRISFASTLIGYGQDENGNFCKIVHVYGDDYDPRDSYEDSSKKNRGFGNGDENSKKNSAHKFGKEDEKKTPTKTVYVNESKDSEEGTSLVKMIFDKIGLDEIKNSATKEEKKALEKVLGCSFEDIKNFFYRGEKIGMLLYNGDKEAVNKELGEWGLEQAKGELQGEIDSAVNDTLNSKFNLPIELDFAGTWNTVTGKLQDRGKRVIEKGKGVKKFLSSKWDSFISNHKTSKENKKNTLQTTGNTVGGSIAETQKMQETSPNIGFDESTIQKIKAAVQNGNYEDALNIAREAKKNFELPQKDVWTSTNNGEGYGFYKVTMISHGKDGIDGGDVEVSRTMLYIGNYQNGKRIGTNSIWMQFGGHGGTILVLCDWSNDAPNGNATFYRSINDEYERPNPRYINLVNGLFDGVLMEDNERGITFKNGKIQYKYDEKTGIYVFQEKDGNTWGHKNKNVIDGLYGVPGFGHHFYFY